MLLWKWNQVKYVMKLTSLHILQPLHIINILWYRKLYISALSFSNEKFKDTVVF